MTDENTEELGPSVLSSLDFWENTYTEELSNFKEHGDVGEIWFGRKNALKIVKWISTELDLDKGHDRIIDIGSGNGMTLVDLAKEGFKELTGVDYSSKAINLAFEILRKKGLSGVELKVCDILDSTGDLLPSNYFKVVHDKGTYDAISMHPEEPAVKRRKYIENIHRITQSEGYLALTSCNWTKDELMIHLKDRYELVDELPTDALKFGGQTGKTVTQLILRKK